MGIHFQDVLCEILQWQDYGVNDLNGGQKRVNFDISYSRYLEFKSYTNGRSMAKVIRGLIFKFVKRQQKLERLKTKKLKKSHSSR